MLTNNTPTELPIYQNVMDSIAPLNLPISGSELHGIMCGYLSAGAVNNGEAYLRGFLPNANDANTRIAAAVLFEIYAISQQQIEGSGFEFQLLLPDEHESLFVRAQSFSEWCDGFTQGIRMAGVEFSAFNDDDAQEAIEHLSDFAEMDFETISCDEQDEHALMEISEFARMAVLHIYSDLLAHRLNQGESEITH